MSTESNVTPAQELRAAASKISGFAGIAPKGPWVAYSDEVGTDWPAGSEEWQLNRRGQDVADRTGSASEHIALWHPGIAEVVAEWLETEAKAWEATLIAFPGLDPNPEDILRWPLRVARAINGEVSA